MKSYSIICMVSLIMTLAACNDDDNDVSAPEITSFSPVMGYEGDEVVIKGNNFSAVANENIVRFGSVQATVVESSVNEIKAVVPEDAADGGVSVRVGSLSTTTVDEFVVLVDLPKEIQDAMSSSGIPSLAMAVMVEGEMHFMQGFGQYDQELTKDADEHTLYVTSSIGKLVVSVAVMQQVELGNVALDQDISDYVGFEVRNPNFPDKVITVQMVMEHGSSLANPAAGEMIEGAFLALEPDSVVALHPTIEDAITPASDIYQEGIWMNVEPGSFHKNSNYGITLLGYMVERLSGQHFNDYSKEKILQPLGMAASSYYYPDLDESKVAVIYGSDGSVIEPFSFYFYPAGMLRTSASDWIKFMSMMLNKGTFNGNKILEPSSVEALTDVKYPANNNIAYDSSIGLIWRQSAANPGWIGHTGAGVGVTHITEINQEKNIAYVLFSNKVANAAVVGPGGTLYTAIHRWMGQIGIKESNTN